MGMERFVIWALGVLLAVVGMILTIGGLILVLAGGSFYYVLAGLAVAAAAVALVRRSQYAVIIYAAFLLVTIAWSFYEVGFDGWALAPRLLGPAVVGLLFLAIRRWAPAVVPKRWWVAVPSLAAIGLVAISGLLSLQADKDGPPTRPLAVASGPTEWRNWGNAPGGSRYVAASQINTGNVSKLELAWRYDSPVPPLSIPSFEGTPLAVDGLLFACLQPGVVAALDQDTGKEVWRYTAPDHGKADYSKLFGGKCRGVSFYEAPKPLPECQKRIFFAAPDSRLLAVDAATGRLCRSFGHGGGVDLRDGMGEPDNTLLALPSSPPAVINGVVVVGQSVSDLGSLDAPSGVVRGYDAETGALRWAWDAARPVPTVLRPGETYTRATPNSWGVMSGDEQLGLVFIPTGGSLPDYYGGSRQKIMERFGTSIVAIDVATGQVRWSFQAVHHDVWDYDMAAQPVVTDLREANGIRPALIVPTKTGQIFVLDRRDGKPIDRVVEKPVPQSDVAGERTSPTQPFTTGFASVAGPPLTESDAWGITPLDQLWCRIRFRNTRYKGPYTPIGLTDTLMYPGTAGGINWGSVSIDEQRGLMIVNALRFANVGRLIPRRNVRPGNFGGQEGNVIFEQAGTPYAFAQQPFFSALGIPCQRPPYGTIQAFDLKTRKAVWSRSLGTSAKSGPLGIPTLLPIRMGVPNMGGSVTTAGGLAFIAAAQDRLLRAYDIGTGRELWNAPLPSVGAATPMSYVSPKTGRQYVVIAAGGHFGIPGPAGGSILAYALPVK